MSARCFVCGSTVGLTEIAHNNWLCHECRPVEGHIVAMSNAAGMSVAECRCGWRSEVAWAHRWSVQDAKVRLHWREVIRRKLAEFDGEFGAGAAEAELVAGVKAAIGIAFMAPAAALLVSALNGGAS